MEKELLKLLEASNLDKNYLKKYSELLTKLRLNNLSVEKFKPFPPGMPNPDDLRINGRLEKSKFGSIAKIVEMKGLERVKLFPKGIINPEFIDLQMQFDARKL